MQKYCVVDFVATRTVGIVARSWIYNKDENTQETFCYWPPNKQYKRALHLEIPDVHWKVQKITILRSTDDFDTAKKMEAAYLVLSDPESDVHEKMSPLPARKRRPVDKYGFQEDDSSDELGPVSITTDEYDRSASVSEPVLPQPPLIQEDVSIRKSGKEAAVANGFKAAKIANIDKPRSSTPVYEPALPQSSTPYKRQSSDSTVILDSPKRSMQNLCPGLPKNFVKDFYDQKTVCDEILSLLRKVVANHHLTTDGDAPAVLECPCNNLDDFNDLVTKCNDKQYKKRVINYLCSLGGRNQGDMVRRIMKRIATNKVWSHFSRKGNKGKKPLNDTNLPAIIVCAVQRSQPSAKFADIDANIGEVLRGAPYQPGGSKYTK